MREFAPINEKQPDSVRDHSGNHAAGRDPVTLQRPPDATYLLSMQKTLGNRYVQRLVGAKAADAGKLQRSVDPNAHSEEHHPLSPVSQWLIDATSDIDTSYRTRAVANAVNQVVDDAVRRQAKMEDLELDIPAQQPYQKINEEFVQKLKAEAARSADDDPNQLGNILAIGRLWTEAFENRLAVDQMKQEADSAPTPELGDYPAPDNPLDLPKKSDEQPPAA